MLSDRKGLDIAQKIVTADGHVSISVLERNNSVVRLVPDDPSVLEEYLIFQAFRKYGEKAIFVVFAPDPNESSVIQKEVTLNNIIDIQFDKSPYCGLILTEDCRNFCFFNDEDDYFLLAGEEMFVNSVQPLSLDLSKKYYFNIVKEDKYLSHYKAIWKMYEPYMR